MFKTSTDIVVFLYWTRNLTNNLLSYLGLIGVRMSGFDKE